MRQSAKPQVESKRKRTLGRPAGVGQGALAVPRPVDPELEKAVLQSLERNREALTELAKW